MQSRFRQVFCAVILTTILFGFNSAAHAQGTHYFWVVGRTGLALEPRQSFVIAVDQATANQINAIKAKPDGIPGLSGKIAAGSVDYNKDYFAKGQPVWNWHFTQVSQIIDLSHAVFPACLCPPLYDNPSNIAADPVAWIAANGDTYTPVNYTIASEVDPSQPSVVSNVSNRGFTGQAEKTAITGFIVSGGVPRNLIIRGLGPSLAQHGVQHAASNPKIQLFVGSTPGSSNTDWKNDRNASVITNSYPSLAPKNDREAAMFRTLLPGAYTIHTSNQDPSDGVVLTEVYDVTSSP